MTLNLDEIKKLIPFYLNKTLSEEEREAVEEALKKHPEIESEIREYSVLKEVLESEPAPEPPGYVYDRIHKSLKKRGSFFQGLREIIESLYNSRTFSWGVVAVQAVLILFLFWHPVSPTYKTLTSQTSHEGIYINVVFKDDIREKTMRTLINRIGGTIVEGPSEEGLYIIRLSKSNEVENAIETLKNSGKVKFVAKAFR